MFTGIVEEIGQVSRVVSGQPSGEICIHAGIVLEHTRPGDSIAVNGVCLTAREILPDSFIADVMPETLRRTNLGKLSAGSRVNLERALAADGRFGGHIVTGHIDGTGIIRSSRQEGNAVWVTVETDKEILDLIVQKGSIAVDGVSLTVAELTAHTFSVSLIPHTGVSTILLSKRTGEQVNLENDILGKYIRRLITTSVPTPEQKCKITEAFLLENGF